MPISTATFSTLLLSHIGAASGITSLVVDRFYNSRIRQNEVMPALSYQVIDISPREVKTGASTYDEYRVQFNCYAEQLFECEQLFDAVRDKFDRFSDETGAVKFHQTMFIDRQQARQDFDTKLYWIAADFIFSVK